ncbi:MAG: hypothetical protein LBH41_00960 [Rickettsiales bacterium]|jgi:hypothetical protein|nr:hypothetical protein [Rickettsiales bacterium]
MKKAVLLGLGGALMDSAGAVVRIMAGAGARIGRPVMRCSVRAGGMIKQGG